MKKLILNLLVAGSLLAFLPAQAYQIELEKVENNVRDLDSLKRGAENFANYCMACHSTSLIRYNRIAKDFKWDEDELLAKVAFNQALAVDNVEARMDKEVAQEHFSTEVPDLSMMTRVRGNDYIYSFLRGYYQEEDESWNNKYLAGTSMPNVLEGVKRHSSEEEYDQFTTDLVNFLDYVAEPSKVQRWDLGWKVILFLFILLIFASLLKREYWKDIK